MSTKIYLVLEHKVLKSPYLTYNLVPTGDHLGHAKQLNIFFDYKWKPPKKKFFSGGCERLMAVHLLPSFYPIIQSFVWLTLRLQGFQRAEMGYLPLQFWILHQNPSIKGRPSNLQRLDCLIPCVVRESFSEVDVGSFNPFARLLCGLVYTGSL